MITWIQKYFQHHFRTIFGVLLALIIVSFVFITNTSGASDPIPASYTFIADPDPARIRVRVTSRSRGSSRWWGSGLKFQY